MLDLDDLALKLDLLLDRMRFHALVDEHPALRLLVPVRHQHFGVDRHRQVPLVAILGRRRGEQQVGAGDRETHLARRRLFEVHVASGNPGNFIGAVKPDEQRWRLTCGIDRVDHADRDAIGAGNARAFGELEAIHGMLLVADDRLLR